MSSLLHRMIVGAFCGYAVVACMPVFIDCFGHGFTLVFSIALGVAVNGWLTK